MQRKNNIDFSNHFFVAVSIFIIAGIFTGIQVFELSMKWTNNTLTVEGACTIESTSKSTSIYFEDKNLNLTTSMWSDNKDGKYDNCKATYYSITKEIIEIQYKSKLDD
ncbi:hypothetical protein [Solibacillus sp. FSL K6-1126]|uniref:hypothetical protein n=1 Tax=Solibacillus sp. FSL K6-1126 TaxID=2921463 RepID=UPI0030FA7451